MKKKDVKRSDCVIVDIRFVPLERVSIVLQKQSTPNQALIIFFNSSKLQSLQIRPAIISDLFF